MKKIFTLVAVIGLALTAMSQGITLTFTGSRPNPGGYQNMLYVQLDSVKVQNINRLWTETLVYPDTVLTFAQTGIAETQGSAAEITSYPNPFNGTTNVAVTMPQSGDATLQVYNLAGQKVAERSMALAAGNNLFEVRLQNPQVYLLAVTTSQGRSTVKLLNRGQGAENAIFHHGTSTVDKRQSANPFQSGDALKIVGYITHNDSVYASQEILQPQTASQNLTLYFFNLVDFLPTVTTDTVSNITDSSAVCGGNVTSDGGTLVFARGVCWSTTSNPSISDNHTSDGTGTGTFTSTITGLTPGTTYYVRAYAINYVDTAYGNEDTITTWTIPTVTTDTVSNITDTSVVCGGNVTSDGGTPVTARGFCWDTVPYPTINTNHTTDGSGTGNFTSSVTGLTAGTTYYVRAYAINSVDTAYGNQITFTTTAVAPTVTTTSASSITTTTATSGGNVTSDGGSAVTGRGVCWSTSQNPTLSNSHTSNGSGTGIFTSSLTGLTAGTTYYVRAYAINSVDTAYGNQITFTTTAVAPTVTTTSASNITSTTATSGGNVTSDGGSAVTARGVCWSTSQNPTVRGNHTSNGSGTGSFTSSLTGLTAGTTYYVRAYAINSNDTAYGNQITFTTTAVAPTVTTTAPSSITTTTATSGGNVTSDGGSAVTGRGVCWSTSQNPTLSNSHTSNGSGTGIFTSSLTGLTAGTTYYVRAYAINSVDTAYGNQITFTTTAVAPTVTTTAPSSITTTTATSGGNVTSDGGSAVTGRGVCWSTLQNPTLSDSHTSNGSGTGSFTSSITGLTAGTTYYVRAYAINSVDTAYGNQITFTTSAVAPTVTTTAASSITTTTATSGGNVTSDGGSAVTGRGVCWSTLQNPTLSDSHTSNGSGTGSFTSSITGLTAGTTYYVRAYAINSVDTAYGNQITFTTTAAGPYTFSVSAGTRVLFSPGNLQWSAKNGGSTATTHTVAGGGTAAGTWRFAPNQWDTIGARNRNISSSYSGWIDLFGWGTSGWDNGNYFYQPYNSSNSTSSPYTSSNGYGYGPTNRTTYTYSLLGSYTRADWGVYNAIYNPKTSTTDAPGTWRTLTKDEWVYLLNTRSTTSGVRYAKATVNGVPGLIIVPDNWSTSTYALNSTNTTNAAYTTNVISLATWTTLENAGCVFLPAAGLRNGTGVSQVGSEGSYWSARSNGTDLAYSVVFTGSGFYPSNGAGRCRGLSVRLVKDAQ